MNAAAKKPARPVSGAPAGMINQPLPGKVLRLTDPDFAPQFEALKKRLRDDPEFGKGLLRNAGIINSKGKLTKAYGG